MNFWSIFRKNALEENVKVVMGEFAALDKALLDLTADRDAWKEKYNSAVAYIHRLQIERREMVADTKAVITNNERCAAQLHHFHQIAGIIHQSDETAQVAAGRLKVRIEQITAENTPKRIQVKPNGAQQAPTVAAA